MSSTPLRVKYVKINGFPLLNIRLFLYSVAFVHQIVTAVVTLTIDMSKDEDPVVRNYMLVRWMLITCWFNVILLGYFPLCLYCDWYERKNEESPHVQKLRILRDVVMTSILVPITTFSDVTFWMLYRSYSNIIAPDRVWEYLPPWAQHSLHTISMVAVVIDLIITPRRRPDSMKTGLAVMFGFSNVYCLMVYIFLLFGIPVYAFLATASDVLLIAVFVGFHVVLITSFYVQWQLIDYIWGRKGTLSSTKLIKIS
ncbi:androgen-dependent TFPI-regulating protein [Helicoverpa armigera]|uniref:androgen-dependent TFPI-regulating protein n=1 Tax=Helicoverpa armigera TaxID=29058 RepID=UPI00308330ED